MYIACSAESASTTTLKALIQSHLCIIAKEDSRFMLNNLPCWAVTQHMIRANDKSNDAIFFKLN
jgi:hypothetical protein